jgi:thiol:disulfide interchange protein
VLAVVVATPCTAPFMGSAVGFALAQPAPVAMTVFTALALGLALPYGVLAWVPALGKILPRPGAWMETLKQGMAFLLFATVIWLVWVLGHQSSMEAVALLLVDFLLLGAAGWVLHRWPAARRSVVAAWIITALAIGLGTWQATDAGPAAQAHALPGDGVLQWERWSDAAVAEARAAGKPVFVDFTAAWCVSCKVNESLVFGSSEVRDRIASLGMVLLKADWTSQDPTITKALASFGRSGVPLYVIYPKDKDAPPVQLPEVITPGLVLDALHDLH